MTGDPLLDQAATTTSALLLPDAVLYAFDIFPDGRAEALKTAGLSTDCQAGAAYRWIHLDLTADGLLQWLSDNTDDIVACSLTEEDTRPRCTPHEQGLLLILRGVNLNPGSDPEDMVSVRIWATEKLILSVRKRRLLAVLNLRERVEAGQGPRSVADFLFTLTDGLTDLMCPVVSGMIEQVDKLEAEILEGRRFRQTKPTFRLDPKNLLCTARGYVYKAV